MSTILSGAATEAELEAIIARTALKYDLLPYTSNPFPQTQPARLGAVARLFGLNPKPLAKARVLELGSAAGGNIIPLAAQYPDAEFVGVDLSRTQVAAGRARITHLGLTNTVIHCKSFTELTDEDGKFDYIICHGVYSWVPAQVRDAILAICRRHLADEGVAMISYNVLPGWRMMQALRDAFLLYVPDQNDSHQRVAQARALLQILKEYSPDTGAYKQILSVWADRLTNLPDDYIAHEFLEEINEPCTFKQFVDNAARHNLAFLGEADLPSMVLDNQPVETANKIREITGNQIIGSEQMLDILNGRTFRQTLLVKSELGEKINRNVTTSSVAQLHIITGGDITVTRTEKGGEAVDGAGRKLSTEHSAVIDAMEKLVARQSASASVAELADASVSPAEKAIVEETILRLGLSGMCTFLSESVPACIAPSKTPTATLLARMDAQHGESATTSLRHERVAFDALGQFVLPLLDGSRDLASIAELVVAAAKMGRLNFEMNGERVTDPVQQRAIADQQVEAIVQNLARTALLQA
jgi:methyltransferase-like protein/cyclopropane fatty-acyl-phospholipid synthase-like methyltransferase